MCCYNLLGVLQQQKTLKPLLSGTAVYISAMVTRKQYKNVNRTKYSFTCA